MHRDVTLVAAWAAFCFVAFSVALFFSGCVSLSKYNALKDAHIDIGNTCGELYDQCLSVTLELENCTKRRMGLIEKDGIKKGEIR